MKNKDVAIVIGLGIAGFGIGRLIQGFRIKKLEKRLESKREEAAALHEEMLEQKMACMVLEGLIQTKINKIKEIEDRNAEEA